MLVGLLVRRYIPAVAGALVKPVGLAATVGLAVLAILVLIVAVPVLARYSITSAAIVVGFVIVAVLVGHLLGGPSKATRVTLAAMLAARFPVPAMILAQSNGAIKTILPVILVYVLAGVLLVPIYARLTRSQTTA
jgi:BASS family bile acid:Na+ symporter